MDIKMWAKVFGVVLLVAGLLGFLLAPNGMLFGILDTDFTQNAIHTIVGIIALIVGFKAVGMARTFFRVIGVVYVLVAVLGFVSGSTVLGLMSVNMADNVLHLAVGVVALWVGFMMKSRMDSNMGGMNMPM
jgi:hypothetical protein